MIACAVNKEKMPAFTGNFPASKQSRSHVRPVRLFDKALQGVAGFGCGVCISRAKLKCHSPFRPDVGVMLECDAGHPGLRTGERRCTVWRQEASLSGITWSPNGATSIIACTDQFLCDVSAAARIRQGAVLRPSGSNQRSPAPSFSTCASCSVTMNEKGLPVHNRWSGQNSGPEQATARDLKQTIVAPSVFKPALG